MRRTLIPIAAAVSAALFAGTAAAQNVMVTPLGGVDGEFCRLDRALIFEDPNGTRLLYDAGRTVAGAEDPPPMCAYRSDPWLSWLIGQV